MSGLEGVPPQQYNHFQEDAVDHSKKPQRVDQAEEARKKQAKVNVGTMPAPAGFPRLGSEALNPRDALLNHWWITNSHGEQFPIFPSTSAFVGRPVGEGAGWETFRQLQIPNPDSGNARRPDGAPDGAENVLQLVQRAQATQATQATQAIELPKPPAPLTREGTPAVKREGSFKCAFCPKGFSDNYKLGRHLRVHTGEKPFSCSVCEKSFARKDKLFAHRRVHTGERPFRCEICGKTYTQRDNLTVHKRLHTGERPYVCSICNKGFTRRDKLVGHGIVHTGLKPFRCEICEKNFARKDKLTVHRRVHTGERPYKCEFCDKSYARKDKLTIHRRAHTGEKVLKNQNTAKGFKNPAPIVERDEERMIQRYYQGLPI